MDKVIFDPIHGYMTFDSFILKVIDTPEFQRLRNIKQLGLTYYSFPGASHNRFEHCLGVSYLAGEIITTIKHNQPELEISDLMVRKVKLAGLLHDIGHFCFSHTFDDQIISNTTKKVYHEDRSKLIIDYMYNKYDFMKELIKDDWEDIKNMIDPNDKNIGFIYEIVANKNTGLDCDKFDYLKRDAYNIGMYNTIDYSRLIKQVRVIDNTLCYPKNTSYIIYELFHNRYNMHKQVYKHKCTLELDEMIADILVDANKVYKFTKNIENVETYFEFTDEILYKIKFSNNPELDDAKKLIDRISRRDLYKVIGKYDISERKKVEAILKEKGIDNDVRLKEISFGFFHKNDNPINDINFYNLEDKNTKFNMSSKEVSKIFPKKYKEKYLYLFSKNASIDPLSTT